MQNPLITRWQLMLPGEFDKFYSELLDYLRQQLLKVPRCPDVPDCDLMWVCPEVYQKTIRGCGDPNFGWMHYLRRFCRDRRLNAEEVREMIEEGVGCTISCDCQIVEAEERRIGK